MSVPAIPAIVDFLKYVAAALTALGVILSSFEKGRKWLVDRWRWVAGLFGDRSDHRVDLKIVPNHKMCQWQQGTEMGKEVMIVYCNLFLTNVAPALPFQILDAYIKRPFTRALIKQLRPPNLGTVGGARLACDFTARFTVNPPVCKSGKDFVASVILVDQYGGKHKAKRIRFEPAGQAVWEAGRKQREHEKQVWEQIKQGQEELRHIQDDLKKLESPEPKKVSQ